MNKLFSMKTKILLGLTLIVSFGLLVGCSNLYGMPNGKYLPCDKDGILDGKDIYWRVRNDNAYFYVSEGLMHECKIIEEDGIIYFVEDNTENEVKYKESVEYDESTKILAIGSRFYIQK